MYSVLAFMHLLGFALAFGSVLVGDFVVGGALLNRSFSRMTMETIVLLSQAIRGALFLLLVSGCGFFLYYFEIGRTDLLDNPKLHSKLLAVLFLCLNGKWLEHQGLPALLKNGFNTLFESHRRAELRRLMYSGAISAISWWFAFVAGVVRELNFSFTLLTFTTAYFGLILAAILGTEIYLWSLKWRAAPLEFVSNSDRTDSVATWLVREKPSRPESHGSDRRSLACRVDQTIFIDLPEDEDEKFRGS